MVGISTVLKVVVLYFFIFKLVSSLKCYSCGGHSNFSCAKFRNDNYFEVTCNETATSCMSVDRENVLEIKSCWSQKTVGCVVANGIKLCSCLKDLCNCQKTTEGATEICPKKELIDLQKNSIGVVICQELVLILLIVALISLY